MPEQVLTMQAPTPMVTLAASEIRERLEGTSLVLNNDVVGDPRFHAFLAEAFYCEGGLQLWNCVPLADAIHEFMTPCPDRPRLDQGRYAVFCGAPSYGGGNRGLLWIDCWATETRAVFLAIIKRRRGYYSLQVYFSNATSSSVLPAPLLGAMHFWLRSHDAGNIVSVDLHNAEGYLYSLDPSHCGLDQEPVTPALRIQFRHGAQ